MSGLSARSPDEEDGVPTSPTGRIPKWVYEGSQPQPGLRATPAPADEATGQPAVERSSRGRNARAVAIAGVLALAAFFLPDWIDHHLGTQVTPPVGIDEAAQPLGTPSPPATADAGKYAFMNVTDEGQPVTWSPCRPIHYVVRPDNELPGENELLTAAIARVSQATGLKFVNDGTTDEVPTDDRPAYLPDKYGRRWAPVLIAWTNTREDPDFREEAAGRAGPTRHRNDEASAGAYVSGLVELDPVSIIATPATRPAGSSSTN